MDLLSLITSCFCLFLVGMAAIDVGETSPAEYSAGTPYTIINLNNPANDDGTIDHIDLYGAENTYDIGAFIDEGSRVYSTNGVAQGLSGSAGDNNWDAPGDFTAFAISSGEFIGTYHASGSGCHRDTGTPGNGCDYVSNTDHIPCSSVQFSGPYAAAYQVGGTGVTSGGPSAIEINVGEE